MKKKAPIVILIILAVAIGVYIVSTQILSNGDQDVSGSGTIEGHDYALGSPLGGIIDEIKVSEGDQVQAGDVIGIIRHKDLLLEKEGLMEAIAAAESRIKEGEIKLANASRSLSRIRSLAGAGSVTRQKLDDISSEKKAASAALEAAKHERNRLNKQFESLGEKISYATVLSPVAGTISHKNFEAGELAPPGSPLVTLTYLDEVWLRLYVTETQLGKVALGQKANVRVDSFPDENFEGKVTWISPSAEFTPKNIQTTEERVKLVYGVKVTIPNKDHKLKIGSPADGEIKFESR